MMRFVSGKVLAVTMVTLALGGLTAAPTMADTIVPVGTAVSLLDSPNTALSTFPGPYATVYIGITAMNTATITVVADPGYLLGDGGSFGFNTSFTGTVGNIAWSGGNSNTSYSVDTNRNESSFGNFNYVLEGFDGFTSAVSALQFTFTLTPSGTNFPGGTSYNPANFLTFNAPAPGGYDAEGHIFVIGDSGALQTGFAAESRLGSCPSGQCNESQVPEPASLLLLGTGLGFVGQRIRRKARRA